jgi:hypothetical protein
MAIEKEIWQAVSKEQFSKDNVFLTTATNADEYVLGGKIVHIPNAGARPSVVKNRTIFPAAAVQRTDNDVSYPLDEFSSDPTHIRDAEKVELSYDKIASVLREHIATIREKSADQMAYNWAATSALNILRTTGAAIPAYLPNGTGNRKKFTKEDLKRAFTLMNTSNVPKAERYALLSSYMLDQLMDDPTLQSRDSSMELDMKNGVIMRLYGFNILERSTVLAYTQAVLPVPIDPFAALTATSNDAILCYERSSVESAIGDVSMFENLNDPQYYGDIYSIAIRVGGRKRAFDGTGVVAIVQDVAP